MDELSNFDSKNLDGLDFCAKVYTLFEDIRNRPNGISNLRLKSTRLEKKIIEELLPICKYIQSKYRAGRYITVCWVDGNQNYDASVSEKGYYIEQGNYPEHSYLEVTCAMHPNEFLGRELLEKEGFTYGYNGLKRNKDNSIESLPVSYTGLSFVKEDSEYILNSIKKKCRYKNTYPDKTTLVVQAFLSTIYSIDEWKKLVEYVQESLPPSLFKEIFIYELTQDYSHSFFPCLQS